MAPQKPDDDARAELRRLQNRISEEQIDITRDHEKRITALEADRLVGKLKDRFFLFFASAGISLVVGILVKVFTQ
jgi:hypothetical protein